MGNTFDTAFLIDFDKRFYMMRLNEKAKCESTKYLAYAAFRWFALRFFGSLCWGGLEGGGGDFFGCGVEVD